MRHAKTEIQKIDQRDFDRNLMERGKEDAKLMGERLAKEGFKPDQILTSNSNRTEQTTALIKQSAGLENVKTVSLAQLYHASAGRIESEIMTIEDNIGTLMIVGHNPGISEFVYQCNTSAISSEIPTSAIVVFKFNAESWRDFPEAKKKLVHYDYPKK
jgi:phosphohistidine phosphatase